MPCSQPLASKATTAANVDLAPHQPLEPHQKFAPDESSCVDWRSAGLWQDLLHGWGDIGPDVFEHLLIVHRLDLLEFEEHMPQHRKQRLES